MKIIKQKLNSLGWLNLKTHHTVTPHPTIPVPSTPGSTPYFGNVHASSSTAHPSTSTAHLSTPTTHPSTSTGSPSRKPRKKALLIGIAESPTVQVADPPEMISVVEGVMSPARRKEVMIMDSPLPITPGKDTFTFTPSKKGKMSGSGPKSVIKSGSLNIPNTKPPTVKKLASAHNDVALMKKALTSWYGYKARDVTVLIDDNKTGRIRPTRDNILAEIDRLVQGVEAGDTLFFYFAGHGTQQETEEVDEEDRKNEVMLTCDGDSIIDNELHERLVLPLPPGSTLIAVCDACHSGSLLDLQHFRCNGVYVPWVSKGKRRSRMEQNKIKRCEARMSTHHAFVNRARGWTPSTIDTILKSNNSATTLEMIPEDHSTRRGPLSLSKEFEAHTRVAPLPPTSTSHPHSTPPHVDIRSHPPATPPMSHKHVSTKSLSVATNVSITKTGRAIPWLSNLDVDSQGDIIDTPQNLYCTGFCHSDKDKFAQTLHVVGSRPHADVICLSSSADSQKTWYDAKGRSMTYQLYKILKNNHNPTLQSLLTSISHSLHKSYLELHNSSRQHKQRFHQINERRQARGQSVLPSDLVVVEMDNFQEPVLSSFVPLPHGKIWNP